jgi:hypothetical protein
MPDLEVVEGGTAAPEPAPAPKKYRASIYPTSDDVPAELAEMVLQLETMLKCKIWCLIQQGQDDFDEMGVTLYKGFMARREEIVAKDRIGLLLHSPGGQINWAYKIARCFQRTQRPHIGTPCRYVDLPILATWQGDLRFRHN